MTTVHTSITLVFWLEGTATAREPGKAGVRNSATKAQLWQNAAGGPGKGASVLEFL